MIDPTERSASWHFARAQHHNLVGFDNIVKMMSVQDNTRSNPSRFVLPLHKNPKTQLILTATEVPLFQAFQIEINIRLQGSGEFIYYGAIDPEGVLRPSSALRSTDNNEKKAVWKLLVMLRDNPKDVLARLGKQTGICCLCNRELTDPISVKFGIGPVCADRYGIERVSKLDLNKFMPRRLGEEK